MKKKKLSFTKKSLIFLAKAAVKGLITHIT
jgi:hypothetical protein